MLEKVKTALRIVADTFNEEIEGIIAAAKKDLELAGINPDENDPLIIRAIILYAKAGFGYTENAERFEQAYRFLRTSLSLSGEHTM